jgi:hypothetical protein
MDAPKVRLAEPTDAQLAQYHSISRWAVAGLALGALGPFALVARAFWAVPILGIVACLWALWQIRQNAPALIGRKAALLGLWLSALWLSAAAADLYCYRWRISGEARQAALFWFQLLAENRPELAFQLTLPYQQRKPLDSRIWDFYAQNQKWRTALENYVAPAQPDQPPRLVRTLLALGPAAKVRYLGTLDYLIIQAQDVVDQLYAVTFQEQDENQAGEEQAGENRPGENLSGEKRVGENVPEEKRAGEKPSGETKTFLVRVRLTRATTPQGRADWQIVEADGGVDWTGFRAS